MGAEGVQVLLGAALYFIPTVIAASRNNPKVLQIGLGNLFLGWTGLGWIGALAFALGEPTADEEGAEKANSSATSPPAEPADPADRLCIELAKIGAEPISEQARDAADQVRFARECFNTFKEVLNQKFKPSELSYERFLSPASDLYQSVIDHGGLALSTLKGLDLVYRNRATSAGTADADGDTVEKGLQEVKQLILNNKPPISALIEASNALSQLSLVDGRVPVAVDETMKELEKWVSRAPLYERSPGNS